MLCHAHLPCFVLSLSGCFTETRIQMVPSVTKIEHISTYNLRHHFSLSDERIPDLWHKEGEIMIGSTKQFHCSLTMQSNVAFEEITDLA